MEPIHASLDGPGHWNPADPAVHVERSVDVDGVTRVTMLSHPTYPFLESTAVPQGQLADAVRQVAQHYIAQVATIAGLGPVATRLTQEPAPDKGFGWLDIAWSSAGGADPRLSFWVDEAPDDGVPSGSALALLAANRTRVDGHQQCQGLQAGLRLFMEVGPRIGGERQVSVTGMTLSGLARAVLTPPEPQLNTLLALAPPAIQQALGFAGQDFSVTGFLQDGPATVHMSGQAAIGTGPLVRVYAWSATYLAEQLGQSAGVTDARKVEQVTCMAATNTFGHDAASAMPPPPLSEVRRRVTRSPALLDPLRRTTPVLPSAGLVPGRKSLSDPQPGGPRFQVLQSRVGNPANSMNQVQTVSQAGWALRSDELAAVHAYQRGQELFKRLGIYGLTPAGALKVLRLPLILRHRAQLKGALDGHAVNAQVRPLSVPPPYSATINNANCPQVEVAFGAANLTHRPLEPNSSADVRQQPLGLAADERWAWHEFGHLLLYANTWQLEMPFVHSIGDALAAIVADPASWLSTQTALNTDEGRRTRHLTFPWARLNRSHGRSAELGWCWCGRRNQRRRQPPVVPQRLFSDYFEEQLMSSSLFTFYEAIGGLPGPNQDIRRRTASHYSVYLLMRAMALQSPSAIASTAQQFVKFLIVADRLAGNWVIDPSPLGEPATLLRRQKGTAHKVLRWAFENQGLYANPGVPADPDVEGKGQPPRVDIFVPGLGSRSKGDYTPVLLDWSTNPGLPAPGWHASPAGLWVEADPSNANQQLVRVSVSNRGRHSADNVQASCWVAKAGTAPMVWTALQPPPTIVNVAAGGTASFQFTVALQGDYLVLAQVSCVRDRANLDPQSGLPCSSSQPPTDPMDLTDLVANDNNLALRVIHLG